MGVALHGGLLQPCLQWLPRSCPNQAPFQCVARTGNRATCVSFSEPFRLQVQNDKIDLQYVQVQGFWESRCTVHAQQSSVQEAGALNHLNREATARDRMSEVRPDIKRKEGRSSTRQG
ncbi:hypothetical protein OIU74_028844 [Salix koriyanagi]|uniref:Uncharacterized protein n=1 Tax=Salix koriyanagi TaxID=2511006 RepID=A0A9Q0ZTD9_9ROSI|nr:hypothetical protein OIU74_028844 [Salix koriyanagi]